MIHITPTAHRGAFWVSILFGGLDLNRGTKTWYYHDHFLRYDLRDAASLLARQYYIEFGSPVRFLECGYMWRMHFELALASHDASVIRSVMQWAFDNDQLRETIENGQEKIGTWAPYLTRISTAF